MHVDYYCPGQQRLRTEQLQTDYPVAIDIA